MDEAPTRPSRAPPGRTASSSHGATAHFRFYAELNDFLPRRSAGRELAYRFDDRPSVKDAIEAQGVPHTEVDLILVNGGSVDFSYRLHPGDRVAVYPVFESFDIRPLVRLREDPLRNPRFVVDTPSAGVSRATAACAQSPRTRSPAGWSRRRRRTSTPFTGANSANGSTGRVPTTTGCSPRCAGCSANEPARPGGGMPPRHGKPVLVQLSRRWRQVGATPAARCASLKLPNPPRRLYFHHRTA